MGKCRVKTSFYVNYLKEFETLSKSTFEYKDEKEVKKMVDCAEEVREMFGNKTQNVLRKAFEDLTFGELKLEEEDYCQVLIEIIDDEDIEQ